jgi:hypothetical protein
MKGPPCMGLGEARTACECAPTLPRENRQRAAPRKKKLKQQELGGEAPTGPGEGHPGPPPNSY